MAHSVGGDLALAVRTLRKSPGFALTTIGTIGLGIGATTAIFSVVNAVLLRPLPYTEAQRVVLVQSDLVARNVTDFPLPPGDFADLREHGTLFEDIAAVSTARIPLGGDGNQPEQVSVGFATPNLLALLGAGTVLGRGFTQEDGTPLTPPGNLPAGATPPPPPPATVVLSHGFWQRRYGADPNILGRVVQLGGGGGQVVGVLAPEFELLFPPGLNMERQPDAYLALRLDFASASRINVFLRFIGRLRPGVTVQQAQAQVDAIVADLRQRYPIKETAGLRWRVEPMHDYLVAGARPGILALMGAVGFVLLIACANVANLLLVRAGQRERELIVRAAMGAGRGALLRQMLAESVVIAGLGALVGLTLALTGLQLVRAVAPPTLPRMDRVSIDGTVLAFTALAALVAAVVFGLVPALRASRPDAGAALRSASRTAGLSGGRLLRRSVVVAEVVLSFVLLVGSGLMIRSFVALQRIDPGYNPDGVLTFQVQAGGIPQSAQRAALQRQLRDRFAALPGVTGVTAALPLPLDGNEGNARWGTEAAATDPSLFQQANVHVVLPDYFAVMGTRLLEGRAFTEADNDSAPAGIVVDRLLAAKAFPGRSAVGQRLLVRIRSNEPEWLTIAGVVEHQRHASLSMEGPEALFVPDGFFGHGAANRWALRTAVDPASLAPAVRSVVAELAPNAPVAQLQPMTAFVARARAPTRFALSLIGAFAGIAGALALVGLYGVLATAVRQRTAEIGIRMTFGASQSSIVQLILREGLTLSSAGIGVGLIAAFALTRVMRSMLVGVAPTDPATFGAISLTFLGVSGLACWLPARRAAALDPNVVLREE
ncbi:MAG TPA: ABC transporter permease [Gemmatimonadales bacterium]|nr:ABC transporter permease [Gemmatimonadales bacterium]